MLRRLRMREGRHTKRRRIRCGVDSGMRSRTISRAEQNQSAWPQVLRLSAQRRPPSCTGRVQVDARESDAGCRDSLNRFCVAVVYGNRGHHRCPCCGHGRISAVVMVMRLRLKIGRRSVVLHLMIVRARHRPAARRERRRSREPHDEEQTERANRELHRQRQIYHNCLGPMLLS